MPRGMIPSWSYAPSPVTDATGPVTWLSKGSAWVPSSTSLVVSAEATIWPVSASTPRCSFRHDRRVRVPCFSTSHSPAPQSFRPVGRYEPADGKARFEVVEEEAAVVRRMFEWVGQERVSLAVVCQRLFEAGVPSPTGKARWRESMASALLTNPAYAGHARFGRRATAPWQPPLRPPRGRAPIPKHPRRRVLAPAEQWISIPVPALIDAALFEGTQEQLGENRRRRRQRKAGARYLLQGLLVCRSCGYALCGRWKASLRSPEQGYRYYRCTGTDSHRFAGQRQCGAKPLPVEPLDAAVWAEVCRLLENPARVADEYQRRLQEIGR